MKTEYDFSNAKKGQFFHDKATFTFPVYLEPDVDEYLNQLAVEKGVNIQELVNEWLRANIKLVKSIQ